MSERLNRRAEGGSNNLQSERKQSIYFKGEMLQEMKESAARLDRSLSWVVQRAWLIARSEINSLPAMSDAGGEEVEEVGLPD